MTAGQPYKIEFVMSLHQGELEEHHAHATSPASMMLTPALLPHVSSSASLMQQLAHIHTKRSGSSMDSYNFCIRPVFDVFSNW